MPDSGQFVELRVGRGTSGAWAAWFLVQGEALRVKLSETQAAEFLTGGVPMRVTTHDVDGEERSVTLGRLGVHA